MSTPRSLLGHIGHAAETAETTRPCIMSEAAHLEALTLWNARLLSIVEPPPANIIPLQRTKA